MTQKKSFGKIKGWHNPLEDNEFWEIRSGLNQVPPLYYCLQGLAVDLFGINMMSKEVL